MQDRDSVSSMSEAKCRNEEPNMRWLRCVLALLAMFGGVCHAQGYPDKARPIRIIVPFGAGGGVDLLARIYAKAITEVAGLNTLVDNKPGAEAVIGVQAFLGSPPDGYTLLITSSSALTLGPVLLPNIPYDPVKDFVPLVGLGRTPFVMSLGPSTSFRTAREFITAARAAPGKYTCAHASTSTRMACELLQSTAGIQLLMVPYKTAPAAMTALAAGEADVHITDPGSSRAMLAAGRARAVAVTGAKRAPSMNQLPTLREEGLADYEFSAWFAAYMPTRTPPEVAAAMREILEKTRRTREVNEFLTGSAIEPLELAGDELTKLNRSEIEMWSRLARTANIKLN